MHGICIRLCRVGAGGRKFTFAGALAAATGVGAALAALVAAGAAEDNVG